MAKLIRVYGQPGPDNGYERALEGRFDPDKARLFVDGCRYVDDGAVIGLNSGSEYIREILYLTKDERWVLSRADFHIGYAEPEYAYVDDATARAWLLNAHRYEDVARYFHPTGERRPLELSNTVAVTVTLPADLLALLDLAAGEANQSRAAWIRDAIRDLLHYPDQAQQYLDDLGRRD